LRGVLVWISDPIDGSRHDMHCLRESGVLLSHGAENWMGDKGSDLRKSAQEKDVTCEFVPETP